MGVVATTFSATARSMIALAVAVCCLGLAGSGPLKGMTDLYELSQFIGSPTDMTGSTTIYGANASYSSATTTYPIGFTFYFDNQPYTTFSPNPGGAMSLGRATYPSYHSYYWPNYSTLTSYYPMVVASWCYAGGTVSNGRVHYKLTGTAPNRVLTVEWLNIHTVSSTSYTGGTWQVRLYEGSNTIEFWYGQFNYTSTYYFSVGLVSSATRYINIWGNDITEHYTYPSGQYYTYRYPDTYPITTNTVFEFAPCDRKIKGLIGNVSEGGTASMKSGEDELLLNKQVQRGNTQGFRPFAFDMPTTPCGQWTYDVSFGGPAAAEYSIAPGSGTLITAGLTPTINFTPRGTGIRNATMTIRISNGEVYTYDLRATGLTRIERIGSVPEGGTIGMLDGDKLLTMIDVDRGSSRDLRPFSLRNTNLSPTNKSLANAEVSFTLDDPNGQYSMRLESGSGSSTDSKGGSILAVTKLAISLAPGATVTPVITFAPNSDGVGRGTGPQPATLTVEVDGEIYTYPICGFAVAPTLNFSLNDEPLTGSGARLFVNSVECVAEGASDNSFVLENPGRTPVVIEHVDVLLTESDVRQGTPPYPMKLEWGQTVPVGDYFISSTPAVAPVSANDLVRFPLVLEPGETRALYLGFSAQRPSKRYARMFMYTDAVNFVGKDVQAYMPNPSMTDEEEGILVMDFFGRGRGSGLAGNSEGGLGELPIIFGPVKVLESTVSETWVYNTGECDLRISRGDLRLIAGDVTDFELLDILPNTTVDSRGDYILPPGGSDKITARFTPSRSGSRRASVLLKTNDSTVVIDGVTDRGSHYLDLYGVGKADLEVPPVVLAPAVIGGEPSRGVVTAYNASTESIRITGAMLTGPNVAEFSQDGSNWPTFPITVTPGESVEFGVVFAPGAASTSGPRSAALQVTLDNTDVVTAAIRSLAGTRSLIVSPASLFTTTSVPVGGVAREYAIISNSGTFPVRITGINLVGDNPDQYSIALPQKLSVDPGGLLFLEVTYRPTMPGATAARIEILNNSLAGTQYVELGGAATSVQSLPGSGLGQSIRVGQGDDLARSVAGIGGAGMQVLPNPLRDHGRIAYTLPVSEQVEIELYDLTGTLVRTLYSDQQSNGGQVEFRTDDVATGTYYIVMKHGSGVVRELVRIVR